MAWWIFGVLGALLAGAFGYVIWAGTFDSTFFFSLIIPCVGYAIGYVYVRYAAGFGEKSESKKRTLKYCWEKANEMLGSMEGGDTLTWYGGKGRESVVRIFGEGTEKKEFRAFYAIQKRGGQLVLIIWDVEGEDIARYSAPPTKAQINDPWHEFKPFEKKEINPWSDPYLRRRNGRRTGISISRPTSFASDDYVRSLNTDPFEEREKRGE